MKNLWFCQLSKCQYQLRLVGCLQQGVLYPRGATIEKALHCLPLYSSPTGKTQRRAASVQGILTSMISLTYSRQSQLFRTLWCTFISCSCMFFLKKTSIHFASCASTPPSHPHLKCCLIKIEQIVLCNDSRNGKILGEIASHQGRQFWVR